MLKSSLLSILFPIFVIFPTLIFLIRKLSSGKNISSKTLKNFPPSPPTFPVIGNLHQLGKYPHQSLQRLAKRYGPLMLVHFGSRPVVIVSSPDAARQIMKTHDKVFASRPKTTLGLKLLYQQRDIITSPYGEYWRHVRSICVLQLLSPKMVHSFRSIREEETSALIDTIRELSSHSSPLNLSDMLGSLPSDIICRAALGRKRSGDENVVLMDLLSDLMRLVGSFSVGDYIPWLWWVNSINGLGAEADRVSKAFDEFLDKVIDEHMRNPSEMIEDEKKDFVDVLLEIQKDTLKAGFSFGSDSIKSMILDMFVAGTDTTHTVLEWTMTELLRHPNILEKLQVEATEIANGKTQIPESDLDKMPYLKAVIKEVLRLYPPGPLLLPRESSQDTKINGFDIPAGTMVMTNAWAIGRDPTFWDQPEEFKPERFLGSNIDFNLGNDQCQWISFGVGRRGCPGALFALVAIELVVANLVHKFDWALPKGMRREDLEYVGFIGVNKAHPLLAVATPRF